MKIRLGYTLLLVDCGVEPLPISILGVGFRGVNRGI